MRIVKVNIFRDNAVGPRLYKIDYGTKLELIGTDLPQTYEVHFSKSVTDDAYRVLGDASGVVVPDVLLETDGMLYGWLYVHTGADDGWTKRSFMCVVQNRSGVQDVVPPPVQQDIIEQSIAALNAGVEEVHEVVEGVGAAIDAALAEAKASGEFDGADGVSPTVDVTEITGGHRVSITDAESSESFDVMNGEDGKPGDPGADGISPTITVTDITGGHRVTITDATGPHSFDVMDGNSAEVPVQDVQVNGVSVLSDGVANVPVASTSDLGVVKVNSNSGIYLISNTLALTQATDAQTKAGSNSSYAVRISKQHISTFYGLAKAAGDTTQSQSSNTVGNYTDSAKSAISEMLSGSVSVSGTTPTINALPGIRYVCGEVTTLDITLPASGIVDVVFESGSTATVLTITPPSGVASVEWVDGFAPNSLSANAVYWVKIIDGKYGVATAWGVQSGGGEKPWNHAHFEVTDASEQTTAFIIPNNEAVSEILVRGKALFDSYDGLYFFINDVALLGPNSSLSNTACYFQIYGKRIAADMWIGRGGVDQWGVNPTLLNTLAKAVNGNYASDGIGDIKIASRWTNKNFQPDTSIDVYWK